MKLQDLPTVDRPREKLQRYGPERLTNVELLAVLLRSGTHKASVMELAQKVVVHLTDKLTLQQLRSVEGIGSVQSLEILACLELGKRLFREKTAHSLDSPEQVWQQLEDIRQSRKEQFVAFYLDTRNQVISRETISIGTLTSSLVHPREVFEPAIRLLAAQIVVAHNHPSGILDPSAEDVRATEMLRQSGKILGIALADHIIVTRKDYFSFKERGLI